MKNKKMNALKLNSILTIDDTFLKFIRFENNRDLFYEADLDVYLDVLNNYMNVLVTKTNNLDRSLFDRINYINSYFKYGKQYDFEEYMDKTACRIDFNSLINILTNEDIYNKFMDFENNKEYFGNNMLAEIYDELKKLIDFYINNNIELSEVMQERFLNIQEKYAKVLDSKNNELIEAINQKIKLSNQPGISYQVKDKKLNEELETKVMQGIDNSLDDFTKARYIYCNLASVVNYDETFTFLNQSINNPVGERIYSKEIEDINIENNNVVCKSWAELYCNLLNKNGIEAYVVSDSSTTLHRYVKAHINGEVIKADATILGTSSSYNYRMSV